MQCTIISRAIVIITHCPTCQVFFGIVPTCNAKLLPGVVLVNFHHSKRGDLPCPETYWKIFLKEEDSIMYLSKCPLKDNFLIYFGKKDLISSYICLESLWSFCLCIFYFYLLFYFKQSKFHILISFYAHINTSSS